MDAAALAVWHTAGAPEPVRFAAAELARYLGRLAGGAAPAGAVVGVRAAPQGAWPALEVRAGDRAGGEGGGEGGGVGGALAARVRPVAAPFATSPGADAFLWRTGAGGLRLAGTNPRATLFGVYDLLEALGCRFYGQLPDDEVVPAPGAAAVAAFLRRPAERFQQATFPYRERHLLEWVDAETTRREIDVTAKRRMNGFVFHIEDFAPDGGVWRVVLEELVPEIARRGLLPGIGEHGGYPLWLPPERYAAAHPEWYAEVGGRRVGGFRGPAGDGSPVGPAGPVGPGTPATRRYQFCTEHPEALATFLGNLERFLRAQPALRILHIAPEDVGGWCECPRCAPIPVADRYLRLDNAIAGLALRVNPEISVTHLVYANHAELPVRERPVAQLKVSFVPFGRDYAHPFAAPEANLGLAAHPWSLDLIRDWARLCRETGAGLIEHSKAFRHRWITFRLLPLPHLVADLRWWRAAGAGGVNAPQEGEGAWVKHLNAYVLSRLLWDLDGPVEALLDDYFERYWAGLGGEVRRVYGAVAAALPVLAYARNQPAHLANRSPGLRPPPAERLGPEAAYLAAAIAGLGEAGRRVAALRADAAARPGVAPEVGPRLARLADAIDGARAGLEVSLAVRRYLLARGTPEAAGAAAQARRAHDRFAALQTPERLRSGTLWTGRWRRDEVFATWEREAAAAAAAAPGGGA
jgi:hypothetical protein